MWETNSAIEKKFTEETHRLIAETQIHKYGEFLDKFNDCINTSKSKFINSYNISLKQVLIDAHPSENLSAKHLTYSDNKILSSILQSLESICEELQLLRDEARDYYKDVIFYDEDESKGLQNIQNISTIVEKMQQIRSYILRVHDVAIFILKQLTQILNKGYFATANNISSFREVFYYFSQVLVCLLTLDSILDSQVLKEHWFLYRRSVRNILHNCSKYDFNIQQVRLLDINLGNLENELLTYSIFKNAVEACLRNNSLQNQFKNTSLYTELCTYFNCLINELEKDDESIRFTENLLELNALMTFTFNLFDKYDKKIFKKVLELNKKASACILFGNVLWYPEHFLLKHLHPFTKLIDEKSIENSRIALITNKSHTLPKESVMLCAQGCYWIVDIEKLTKKKMSNLNTKHLQNISNLLIDGLRLVKKISLTIKWVMNLYSDKCVPITKTVLLSLCKLIEVLKCIYLSFKKNSFVFIYSILLITQQLSYKASSLLHNLKKSYLREKTHKQNKDVISALTVCERILQGPNSNKRLLLANLSLSASGLSNDPANEIRSVINRLNLISNFSDILKNACDCSFLYWHQMYILPVYFSKLLNSKADLSRYYLILEALSDSAFLVGNKINDSTSLALKQYLTSPLNQFVETNLRLQTHLHLQLPLTNPIKSYYYMNFAKYLPSPINFCYKSLKNDTEHYLSTMFYNLTTVVLHDWKTYGEMRKLAYLQYGLETVDDNLPMQTLEQGLDVLEIMRNINVFVNKYLYNLNSQVFVEASSNNKHLNTINISHVANSIRTHGIGIMNTTVNFTYQFLRNQFYVFSQFMFDEHIKSRLLKDLRFFSEHKTELNQMYPYERAEKFNIGIKKLGLNQKGQSYLDLFRKVITHIGNAMGYIRLIRSGGRRCLADGTCFIPDLKDIDAVSNMIDENLSELTRNAGNCLTNDLNNLVENFEEATEYFKLLVNVFVPVLRNKNNIHLKNFYIIVPPLTINFIENSLTCKERLNKKNKADCAFTDDGFALGLAFIIEILNQESQLNTIHWFHSVQKKFKMERLKIKQQKDVANHDDDKLRQTLTLTEKRISTFERVMRKSE